MRAWAWAPSQLGVATFSMACWPLRMTSLPLSMNGLSSDITPAYTTWALLSSVEPAKISRLNGPLPCLSCNLSTIDWPCSTPVR
ncbi:hypothetical protein D3C71_1940220 [compost metagenome]